jgi:shikimate kinase
MKRVGRRDNRPLLQVDNPEAVMKKLMAERHPIYADADITIETREAPHEVMVGNIVDALASRLAQESPRATEDRIERRRETD